MQLNMKYGWGILSLLGAMTLMSPSASAGPIGTLNVDSCNGSGVTITATTISFTGTSPNCITASAAANVTSTYGNINPGLVGTIANLLGPIPPGGISFMTFDPTGGTSDILTFILTSLGPGSNNTNCASSPCSVFAGSPVTLTGDSSGTTAILPAFGTVTDASGTSNWEGRFSANFGGQSPLDLQNQFNKDQSITTGFSGSFALTVIPNVPEPATFASLAAGLGLIAIGAFRRSKISA